MFRINKIGLLVSITAAIFQFTPSSLFAAAQSGDITDEFEANQELLFNVTYNGYKGLCNACVFASDRSVYLINSPYCTFEFESQTYNIGEMFDRHLCFYDDPRFYDVECFSKIGNNTFDCTRTCDANKEGKHDVLREGRSYELPSDSRCIYKIDFNNKLSKAKLVGPASMYDQFTSELKDEVIFDDDRRQL